MTLPPTSARPKRIRRQRTKGWRMPPNTVYVGRPTEWGNPFTGPDAVEHFRLWIMGEWVPGQIMRQLRPGEAQDRIAPAELPAIMLAGYNLACWCPLDQPCHADVLLELANP